MSMQDITFIDLFAGIGGFRLGLEAVGFKPVFSADNHPHAVKAYYANYAEDSFCDITTLDAATIPDFDIMTAGFPCQPFSKAGRGHGFTDATRGTLFFDLCRILEAKKPTAFIFENVKNILTHDSRNTIRVIEESLNKLGYTVTIAVLNANQHGVPQSRERVFIVGNNQGVPFDFNAVRTQPVPSIANILEEDQGQFKFLEPHEYTLLPAELVKTQKTGLIFTGYRNKAVRQAGVNADNMHHSRTHRQPNRIYDSAGTHPTLSSQEKSGRYFILHDGRVRSLTLTECYRLMGFPDDFIRIGPGGEDYARIGNSVCIPLISDIAQEVKNQIFVK